MLIRLTLLWGGQTGEIGLKNERLSAKVVERCVNNALHDYFVAFMAGDSRKVVAIQQAVAQNEQIAMLFAQRIEQIKQAEQNFLRTIKKDIQDYVVSRFKMVINDVTSRPSNTFQAIPYRNIDDALAQIQSFKARIDDANRASDMVLVINNGEKMLDEWLRLAHRTSNHLAEINRGYIPNSVEVQISGIRTALLQLREIKEKVKTFLSKMSGGYFPS